jgi:hypothetical protein
MRIRVTAMNGFQLSFYTVAEARSAGFIRSQGQFGGALEVIRKSNQGSGFDIFLSHSLQDAQIVLGIREILQRSGQRVYVDWIDDPLLDRSKVSAATASRLRERMNQCRSLVYAASESATNSKWMPWELGYFDGRKSAEAVAIMPIVSREGGSVGQEYIDLYPKIERGNTILASPVVTRGGLYNRQQKTVQALVEGRGGMAWR